MSLGRVIGAILLIGVVVVALMIVVSRANGFDDDEFRL